MNEQPQRINVEDYAELKSIVDASLAPMGAGSLILPNGGADRLIERLTCQKCGRLVCPVHDRSMRQKHREPLIKVPLDETRWTPFFPERIAQEVSDGLLLTV